ncbi:MAG: hypothetical protein IE931_14535 [Sphingobacteriales bacterium]|nr:hypothetical protein [Sphingobacteriales bacterium]
MNKSLGIIFVVIGVAMLIWTGFNYTKKEKVIDAGPLQVSVDKQESVNWPPYVGGVILIAGVVLLVTTKKS